MRWAGSTRKRLIGINMGLFEFLFGKSYSKPKIINSTDRDLMRSRWSQIEGLVKLGGPSQLRQAIIEADNLLALALKRLVNEDQSLGDNLKQAKDLFPSWDDYQKAWEAHKVRNALVHEAGYEPPHYMAKDTIMKFNEVLQVLQAL